MAQSVLWEAKDPEGSKVQLAVELWQGKILQGHPELAPHAKEVLLAVHAPDLIEPDPLYAKRRRYYLRDAGPSRWLLVVVSYEQKPARIVSAFGTRKDPRSWNK